MMSIRIIGLRTPRRRLAVWPVTCVYKLNYKIDEINHTVFDLRAHVYVCL